MPDSSAEPDADPLSISDSPPAADSRPAVPLLPNMVVGLLGIAAAIVAAAGVRTVASIIAPVFLALNLVIVVNPLQSWLRRHRVPTLPNILISYVALVGVVLGLLGSIIWAAAELVLRMPAYRDQFERYYQEGVDLLGRLGVPESQISDKLRNFDYTRLFGVAQSILSGVQNFGSLVILLLTVMIFMVTDAVGFGRRLEYAARTRPQLVSALRDFSGGVRQYWMVSTVFGLIVAVLDTIALLLLGVPLALAWGVLSFVTNYIPNVGFVLGVIPPALLALFEGGPGLMLTVIVVYSVLNFIVQSVIQPKYTGDAVGMTTTMVFLSLLVWTYVLGPLGALLAVPASLLVKALVVDHNPDNLWANAFIASDPKTALPARSSPDDPPPPAT